VSTWQIQIESGDFVTYKLILVRRYMFTPFFAGLGSGMDLLFLSTFGGPFVSLLIAIIPQFIQEDRTCLRWFGDCCDAERMDNYGGFKLHVTLNMQHKGRGVDFPWPLKYPKLFATQER